MSWVLSDGTVISPGGEVEGNTALAYALRDAVAAAGRGFAVPVQVEVVPSAPRALDLADAQLVDVWIRAMARRYDASVTSAPEIKPIERRNPPLPEDADADTVY